MTSPVGHQWSAFSRDLGYRTGPGLPISKLAGVLRHLGVDTCELVTPYTAEAYGRLAPGCGIVAQRDGVQQFSGMIGTTDGSPARSISYGPDGAWITVRCLSDEQHLADRLVLPSPQADPSAQTANYWTITAPASTAMYELIRQQAGPGANASRRIPTLYQSADPVVGVTRLWSEQFASVLSTLQLWGVLSGANLGVRVVTTVDGLRADVYVPRDVSASVRFSTGLTNLTGFQLDQAPPTVMVAIAAGQGDLASRVRRVAVTGIAADLAWGRRIELYLDQRDEADTTKLLQTATDAVVQGIGTTQLNLVAQDTATAQYGVHWYLGDRVTVHIGLPEGPTVATVTDLIREVAFTVDGKGNETITPAVGTSDATAISPGPTQLAIARVAAGLARLTRNK